MLAAYLAQRRRLLDGFDLVIASPTFVGPGGREFDHTRLMLTEAARRHVARGRAGACDLGPIPAIVKTGPTPRARRPQPCRASAHRPGTAPSRPSRPRPGTDQPASRILVVDDVFTDGRTLDEVARALRLQGGAREVCGLALCRQPWRGS